MAKANTPATTTESKALAAAVAKALSAQGETNAVNAATPENTPVPGGGSWRWGETHWVSNTPAVPVQPGEVATLETDPSTTAPTSE